MLSELLVDFDRYNISEEDGKYYLRKGKAYMRYPTTHGVPGDKIELQEFLKNVNFNHINFTDAEVNAYTTLIESAMYDGSRPLPLLSMMKMVILGLDILKVVLVASYLREKKWRSTFIPETKTPL